MNNKIFKKLSNQNENHTTNVSEIVFSLFVSEISVMLVIGFKYNTVQIRE